MSGPAKCASLVNTVTQTVTAAAVEAGNRIANLIPGLTLKWDFLSILLLKPQKLFCKEIYTTPNFENSPCADQLGCGTAGQGPPDESEVETVPPEQVDPPTVERSPGSPGKTVQFGFEFIQIGNFRLGAVDDNHFSISRRS
ncbi:unnamed protein product [Symbiodinium necroappetens]|uniref:Uncharacterized protein n=1 Tax=Symbiodinium necroappetens TaxID=1628268 RepID=A0A813C246_9DINO|nr:unnamed protein product [Symbiodinium necroappetens]